MWRLIFLLIVTGLDAVSISWHAQERDQLGRLIFHNECGSDTHKLIWWNPAEPFPSLGIGHFLWYPENSSAPFEETFPALIALLEKEKVELPPWLSSHTACPWPTRQAFLEPSAKEKKEQLLRLLQSTFTYQTLFIQERLNTDLTAILLSFPEEQRDAISARITALCSSFAGKFALIDYLNFKGSGLNPQEQYQGIGWGLKQVLAQMPPDTANPVSSFADTAIKILTIRTANSPSSQQEEKWLAGWKSRIIKYTQIN